MNSRTEKNEELKSKLLNIRQKCWFEHFCVPTVEFIRTFNYLFEDDLQVIIRKLNVYMKKCSHHFLVQNHVFILKNLPLLSMPTSESNGLFIKTLNAQGYMATQMDSFSEKFVQLCQERNSTSPKVLEIGSAYGISSLKACETGVVVFMNDLDADQLHIAYSNAINQDITNKPITLPAQFPEEPAFQC